MNSVSMRSWKKKKINEATQYTDEIGSVDKQNDIV